MARKGFFTDTTLCIGCKACEVACKQWNQLPDDGFRFTVHATTANWMRPFFPADDLFETRADARLFPSEYRVSLNEGRRHLTRTVVFDTTGRHLFITTGQTSVVTLPLARGARDPVSTFFYMRTLPLAADFRTRVPVDDARLVEHRDRIDFDKVIVLK